ncbi:glycosyltransferase family 2 protein [Blastococcus tunisiensis]|uniref:Glycosyltransferase, GT2 family n=1 Tax=Blastococcus tunisiensis TaxID=1798228 RepID=A0A1I1XFG8_9ACTN|nr:glycosyltransferase [Blastococcus sp. DSM 46838]SFE04120.1 Glycosyltransferase, GT2 family [Blastococcus sp. DSM 46838]
MGTASLTALDVELVIVAYRSRPQVEGLLAGLPADVRVVVVDNSDGSDGLAEFIAARPGSRYLSGGGVGFARAANLGARTSEAEFLAFVNPDVRPTDVALAALVADVAGSRELAASAATRVDGAGRPQMNGGWEFSVRRALVHATGAHKRLLPMSGMYATPQVGVPLHVDWVSGGCMAVRRQTFLDLGCFDETFYVYCEDVAYGRAAREHGLSVRLRTDVTITGDSGGSGAPSLEMARLRGASLTRYVRKHHSPLRAGAISGAVALGYAVRTAQQLVRRNRSLAAQYWAYTVGAVTARATVAGRVVTR